MRQNLLLSFLVIFSLFSCSKNYNTGIYRTGRVWKFEAYFYDAQNQLTDSCSLQMAIGKGGLLSSVMNQRELNYTYGTCCGKDITETTGVDERQNYVFIHPPRLACFSFTEIPPMPEINLPINMTCVSNGELKIVKSEMTDLSGKTIDLSGKTIKQKERLVKKEAFGFTGTTLQCVVIEGENTNYIRELGVYKSQYLFNEYYGFVQLTYYKPSGESVKIVLKTTNFR